MKCLLHPWTCSHSYPHHISPSSVTSTTFQLPVTSIRHGHPPNPNPNPSPETLTRRSNVPMSPLQAALRVSLNTGGHVNCRIAESAETRFNCDKMGEIGDDHRDSELCYERALLLLLLLVVVVRLQWRRRSLVRPWTPRRRRMPLSSVPSHVAFPGWIWGAWVATWPIAYGHVGWPANPCWLSWEPFKYNLINLRWFFTYFYTRVQDQRNLISRSRAKFWTYKEFVCVWGMKKIWSDINVASVFYQIRWSPLENSPSLKNQSSSMDLILSPKIRFIKRWP